MFTFGRNVIGKRVMSVINARVEAAQVEYDDECTDIDNRCEADIEAIRDRAEQSKENLADSLVERIIGRV